MTGLYAPLGDDSEVGLPKFERRLRVHQGIVIFAAIVAFTSQVTRSATDTLLKLHAVFTLAITIPAAFAFIVNRRRVTHVTISLAFCLSLGALGHAAVLFTLDAFGKRPATPGLLEPLYLSCLLVIVLSAGTAPWGPNLRIKDPPQNGIFGVASLDEENEDGVGDEECLLDAENKSTDADKRTVLRIQQSSILSFLFMNWASDLVLLANRKPQLDSSDIPRLPRNIRGMTATLYPNSLFYKILAARKTTKPDGNPQDPLTSKLMLWMVIKTNWKMLLVDFGLRCLAVVISFAPPFILHELIGSFGNVRGEETATKSDDLQRRTFLLCGALFLSQSLNAIISTHNEFLSEVYILSLIRAQVAAILFDKALTQQERISGESEHTSSKVINLLTRDSQSLPDGLTHFRNIVIPILRLSLGCVFIYKILGWSGVVAMLFAFVLFPASSALSKWSMTTDRRLSHAKDKRVSLVQETVAAIKTIKLNAWESKANERITELRTVELKYQRERYWVGTIWNIGWGGIPVLIQLIAFLLYTVVQGKILTPSTAFVALNVFHICSAALTDIPTSINSVLTGVVSLQRVVAYLNGGDLQPVEQMPASMPTTAVLMADALITWPAYHEDQVRYQLYLGHLSFPRGKLSLVSGPLGSGKTLLLRAILGEAQKLQGQIYADTTERDALPLPEDETHVDEAEWCTRGMVYVPQTAYIRHASIRDNILFGLPFDARRYQACIEQCALIPDLALLEDGDLTEVGEKGVTLSGGQKARLSLARAVYSRAETLIIDDVLAAVDAHTAFHLVTECLQGPLLMDRTVILATHSVNLCLPTAAYVVVLANGSVGFQGIASDYEALVTPKATVSSPGLVESHLNSASSSRPTSRTQPPLPQLSNIRQRRQKLVKVESRAMGRVTWSSYLFVLRSSGAAKYWIVFAVAYVGLQVLYTGQSIWIRKWTSSIGESGSADLGFYLGMYAVIVWCGIIFDAGRWIWLYQGLTTVGARVIHSKAVLTLLRQSLRFFDTTPQGRILTRFANDITRLDTNLPDDVGRVCMYGLQVIACIGMILTVAPSFGIVIFCSAPFFGFLYSFYIKGSRDLRRIEMAASAPVITFFAECATIPGAAAVLRAYGACRLMMITMMRVRDIERANTYAFWASQLWAYLIINIGNSVIASATGVLLVWKIDSITPAQAGFTLLLANDMASGMLSLLQRLVNMELTMVSGQRVYEYVTKPIEASALEGKEVPAGWPFAGEIVMKDLHAGYAPGLPDILRGVNLQIQPGERVGIVGATGGGKSTLVSTLFRLVDIRSGCLLIDGVDISQIRLADLRSRLTIVPQDPVLMSGTLRTTLDYLGDYDDAAIFQALKSVHLLPDSTENDMRSKSSSGGAALPSIFADLDTVVASGGANFSLGQRQLLVLAQSMLRQSKILVLDEATASIDHETDAKITETIRNEFHGSTLLVVAHRLRTIIDFDKVIVVKSGQIAEFGSPCELLDDKSSDFTALCQATGAQQYAELQKLAAAARKQ